MVKLSRLDYRIFAVNYLSLSGIIMKRVRLLAIVRSRLSF